MRPNMHTTITTSLKAVTLMLCTGTLLWHGTLTAAEQEDNAPAQQRRDAGLSIGVSQSPFVGGKEHLTVRPAILKHGGLRIDGFNLPVYQQPAYSLYLGVGTDDWSEERDDSPLLADMDELDKAINLRAGIATQLGNGWLTGEAAQDLAGAHEGLQAKLRYTTSVGSAVHEIRPYLELQWLSADLNNYYVGVDSNETTAIRPQYEADDEFAIKAGLGYRRPLSDKLTLIGSIDFTQYGDEISESPIIEDDSIWGANLGLTYRWK